MWVGGGGGEIIADVKQIDGVAALVAKLQLGLLGNPRGTVAQGVNLAVEGPAGRACRLRPAQAGVGHVVQGGAEVGGDRAVGLRGDQARFLIARLPMLAPVGARGCRARVDDGHHRAVGFGHDLRGAVGRQGPHRLRRLRRQHLGVVQRDGPHALHRHAHPVVLLHFGRGGREGMIGPEVGQRALQAPRAAPRLHLGGGAKRPLGVRPAPPELLG